MLFKMIEKSCVLSAFVSRHCELLQSDRRLSPGFPHQRCSGLFARIAALHLLLPPAEKSPILALFGTSPLAILAVRSWNWARNPPLLSQVREHATQNVIEEGHQYRPLYRHHTSKTQGNAKPGSGTWRLPRAHSDGCRGQLTLQLPLDMTLGSSNIFVPKDHTRKWQTKA